MKEIKSDLITATISEAVIKANYELSPDLENCIRSCEKKEKSEIGKTLFKDMLDNLDLARDNRIPICQDTGMTVIFAEIGQDVHIIGDLFEDAVNEGVRQGYQKGYLRKSVVKDPIMRNNTNDNTPAIIHTRIVAGEKLSLTIVPKGFGSENMSRIKMFLPSAAEEEIIDFVVETVKLGGGNPCPPVVLGVGIGGDFEYAALLAKKALTRDVSQENADMYYCELEKKMLDAVNKLGIGAQGFGGNITALAVNIEQFPTHIAGLPVAVNVGCHVTRHITVSL